MNTLHIAPGYSAGGSLIRALDVTRPQDEVLSWPDNLSCGPIATDDAAARAEWWDYDEANWESTLESFWDRVFTTTDKLIVWYARHSAMELAFFLNWTHRLGDRPYEVIDPTGMQFSVTKKDGSPPITRSTTAVSELRSSLLASLLGTERALTSTERKQARKRWQTLKSENAPFRIVTENGLVSAPIDYFDNWLLTEATHDWKKMAYVIGSAMDNNHGPYTQVGDQMLHARTIALIEAGALLAEGNPMRIHESRIRLP